jgi:hypothetical protein
MATKSTPTRTPPLSPRYALSSVKAALTSRVAISFV